MDSVRTPAGPGQVIQVPHEGLRQCEHTESLNAPTNLAVVGVEAVTSDGWRCDLHGVKIKAWKPIREERMNKGAKEGRGEGRGKELGKQGMKTGGRKEGQKDRRKFGERKRDTKKEGSFTDVSVVSERRGSQGGRKMFP